MESAEVQPHTKLTKADIRPVVLVVGDPGRCQQIADVCMSGKEIAYNREYRTFLCNNYNDKSCEFLVVSHGVGGAGAALCFRELIQLGAKVIIRAGTSGSLNPSSVKQGDIIAVNASVREDGVTKLLVPECFPAVSCPILFNAIINKAKDLKINITQGIGVSSDLFYASPVLPSTLDMWSKAGCQIIEMENSTLLIIAHLYKIQAACLSVVDGCPLQWEDGNYDPSGKKANEGKASMLKLAIEVVSDQAKQHSKLI